jgi:hypothetical protein
LKDIENIKQALNELEIKLANIKTWVWFSTWKDLKLLEPILEGVGGVILFSDQLRSTVKYVLIVLEIGKIYIILHFNNQSAKDLFGSHL